MKIIFKIPHFQNKFLTKNLQKKKIIKCVFKSKKLFLQTIPNLIWQIFKNKSKKLAIS